RCCAPSLHDALPIWSTLGSISDTRYLVARPREPRYSSAHCTFSGSSVQVPAVRFTRRTLRFHPMTHPPQAAAEAGVLALAAQARILSMPVQSASTYVMAPVGQALAQAGLPSHRSHFCTLPLSWL